MADTDNSNTDVQCKVKATGTGEMINEALKNELEKVGLDVAYWGIHFNNMKVETRPQLFNLRGPDFDTLYKGVRENHEKVALQNLLKIIENEDIQRKGDWEKDQVAKFKEKTTAIETILRELEKKQHENKSRADESVKELETKLLASLNIKESDWISTHKNLTLDELTATLKSEFAGMGRLSDGHKNLSEKEVIEGASAGLALRGVYLSGSVQDETETRRKVISCPDVKFMRPAEKTERYTTETTSRAQHEAYKKAMKTLGRSLAVDAHANYFIGSIEGGLCKSKEETCTELNKHSKTKTFMSRTLSLYMPRATCEFTVGDLRFSADALSDICEIDEMISMRACEDSITKKCKEFLDKFGSHINSGLLHFGGIYDFQATYEDDETIDTSSTTQTMSDALSWYSSLGLSSLTAGGDFRYSEESKTGGGSFEGTHKHEKFSKISLSTATTGGPSEDASVAVWSMGLASFNDTWALINRGTRKEFTEIWKLLHNHSEDFSKLQQLQGYFRDVWHSITKSPVDNAGHADQMYYAKKEIIECIDKIMTDIAQKDSLRDKCISYLQELQAKVDESKINPSHDHIWPHVVSSDIRIPEFINSIIKLEKELSVEVLAMAKQKIKHLFADVSTDYVHKAEIIKWYGKPNEIVDASDSVSEWKPQQPVRSITDFVRTVDIVVIPKLEKDETGAVISATTHVQTLIAALEDYLNPQTDWRQLVLFEACLLKTSYQCETRNFARVLTLHDLRLLCDQLEKGKLDLEQLSKASVEICTQAFLLRSVLQNTTDYNDEKRLATLSRLKSLIPNLSPKVDNCISHAIKSKESWSNLEAKLFILMEGKDPSSAPLNDRLKMLMKEIYTRRDDISLEAGLTADTRLANVLAELGLSKYFPMKIDSANVICLESAPDATLTENHLIPWKILRGIVRLDSDVRFDTTVARSTDLSKPNSADADLDLELDEMFDTESKREFILHPSDVFLAIYSCCNLKLRQIVAQKMFTMKAAFPFLLNFQMGNTIWINLWALRPIVIEWCDINGSIHEESCVELPSQVVSMVRIGRHSKSKSDVLNRLISQKHNVFYTRESKNSSSSREIEGYVECAWFMPSKDSASFEKVTLFLNLRGDASDHKVMSMFQTSISAVTIVMVDIKDISIPSTKSTLNDLRRKCKDMIVLLLNNAELGKGKFKEAARTFLVEQEKDHKTRPTCVPWLGDNNIDVIKKLKEKLIDLLKKRDQASLESIISKYTTENSIIVDEQTPECAKARKLADDALSFLTIGENLQQKRGQLLPLQSKTWEKICQLQKQERRFLSQKGEEGTITQKGRIKEETDQHRKLQFAELPIALNHVGQFVKIIGQWSDSECVVDIFLKWVQLKLDSRSRKLLPELRTQCHKAWDDYRAAKDDKKCSEGMIKEKITKIQTCDEDMRNKNIGLEHMFREIGQMYESVKCNGESIDKEVLEAIEIIPRAVAKLIKKGHTFEILDGDVASIPTEWVKTVLRYLKEEIGDEKLFVISILGQQSSGKSTLLNTLFGAEFAVSAGQCTKGVYTQLLPILEYRHGVGKCKYALVIDSEGLQGPELSFLNRDHDNELATLTLGLADLTIINIKGENTMQMRDTLQIAMYAFLKMKMVNSKLDTKQKCLFIHNNVPSLTAEDKLKHDQAKFEDDLDTCILQAAEQLKCGNISSFREILDYHSKDDVKYLSDLWCGDPPMAPVNHGYTKGVSQIREHLIAVTKSTIVFKKLSETILHLNSLWDAILEEDFVFSFRNTLEIKAYEYITHQLQEIKKPLADKIMSPVSFTPGTENKEENNSAEITFSSCKTTGDLLKEFDVFTGKFDIKVAGYVTTAQEDLTKCFDEGELKDITIQWKNSKLTELKEFSDKTIRNAKKKMRYIRDVQQLKLINDGEKVEIESRITKEASLLAEELKKNTYNEEQLQAQFDAKWSKWSEGLPKGQKESVNIGLSLESILSASFHHKFNSIISTNLNTIPIDAYAGERNRSLVGSFKLEDITGNDYSTKGWVLQRWGRQIYNQITSSSLQTIMGVTDDILSTVQEQLKYISFHDKRYEEDSAKALVELVISGIKTYNDNKNSVLDIKTGFVVRLAIHVCRYAYPVFLLKHNEFEAKNSIGAKIEGMKKMFFTFFMHSYKNSTLEVQAAAVLCEIIEQEITQKCLSLLPDTIESHMLGQLTNKKHIIVSMLSELTDSSNFEKFVDYIANPSSFAKCWIQTQIEAEWFCTTDKDSNTKYETEMIQTVRRLVYFVRNSVEKTLAFVNPENSFAEWINNLCSYVGVEYKISLEFKVPDQIGKMIMSSVTKLPLLLEEGFDRIQISLETELVSSKVDIELLSAKIHEKCWGCTAQCPFCDEPCADSTANHEKGSSHRCVEHRPIGTSGWRFRTTKELIVVNCEFAISNRHRFRCNYLCQKAAGCIPPQDSVEVFHNYTDYNKYFKDWKIDSCSSVNFSPYWCWFMANYKNELVNHYKSTKMPDIPASWYNITREKAKESLLATNW